MIEFLSGLSRTDYCGKLTADNDGKNVVIMGWVHRRRDMGGLIFLQLRDISGICQVVFAPDVCDAALMDKAATLKLEYVVAVKGCVRLRTGGNVNKAMATGEIEVVATELIILSEAETTPFSVGDSSANELLRLQYRYLDLRRAELQSNLVMRSKICAMARNYLAENGFLEIETPMLGKSTPEGARDYLVPSRVHPAHYYALPQSPQLYKQLLMIGGMDRYYQIARCFRDEDLRANRQPEFTQIDIEMSFVDREESLMQVIEGLVKRFYVQLLNIELPSTFERLTFAEAMRRFGTDKPDLRYGMEINDISSAVANSGFVVFDNALAANGTVSAIVLKGQEDKLSRKEIDHLTEFVKTYKAKGLAYIALNNEGTKGSLTKALSESVLNTIITTLNMQQGDIAFIVSDASAELAQTALGALRCHLAEKFGLINKDDFKVLWIVDFPLLEYSEEEGRFVARHHPFTAPKDEDLPLLDTAPEKARAKAYDLVINGDEIGGGSMRIYNRALQRKMFEVIGLSEYDITERFGYFVNAFNYGTPPHGGFAFGLDRLVMTLCKTENIKEVIAFPKTQTAACMMTKAPSEVDAKQLDELFIVNTKKE